jgi:hypothetical protein
VSATRRPQSNPSPSPQSLCIGGTLYRTAEDDEFSQDKTLNYTNNFIASTPAPDGAIWSSKALGFADGGRRNNIGVDDAFYTNPLIGPGFDPFAISGGALNITTEPIPKPYTPKAFHGAHWLSGVLEGPALTYGYVEVSAKEPNLQGFWPAPLWLLGLDGDDGKGHGYEELDVNELFGNSLGASVVQQTQVFSPTDSPPRDYVRWYVDPNPSTAYHTYGVLWTPSTVSYYIDRQSSSPAYPNAANGPANPLIILQVFAAKYGGAQPPATKKPQTMHLKYYRWYQTKGASCSPTVVATPPPTYPPPTPGPKSTPVPNAPVVTQNSGVIDYPVTEPMSGVIEQPPQNGDLLLAFILADAPVTPPTGWTEIDGQNLGGDFQMYAGSVGSNGLGPATSYSFGSDSGIIELLDISGAPASDPGLVGQDPEFPVLTNIGRSVSVPQAGGLLLSAWTGYTDLATGFEAIGEILPTGQFENPLSYSLNNAISIGGSASMRVSQIIGDPFSVPQPYTIVGTSAVLGDWGFDGDVIWVRPAN